MGQLSTPNTFVAGTAAKASEVNANFEAVESVVNGNIDTTNLKDVSVTTGKLADSAVTTAKIADDAVTSAKIADNAVTAAKLASDAVTGSIGDEDITTDMLTDGAVTTVKLADDAVTASKLGDGAVTSSKLGDGSVAFDKLTSVAISGIIEALFPQHGNTVQDGTGDSADVRVHFVAYEDGSIVTPSVTLRDGGTALSVTNFAPGNYQISHDYQSQKYLFFPLVHNDTDSGLSEVVVHTKGNNSVSILTYDLDANGARNGTADKDWAAVFLTW